MELFSWSCLVILFNIFHRFPSIMPILDADYAADTIINAVLTNKYILMMPANIALTAALKT